jgi:hypothetical protein
MRFKNAKEYKYYFYISSSDEQLSTTTSKKNIIRNAGRSFARPALNKQFLDTESHLLPINF